MSIPQGTNARAARRFLPEAKKLGLDVKVVKFTDDVIPNRALANREVEIDSFQYEPYLKNHLAKTT